jgi:hypothetical protein
MKIRSLEKFLLALGLFTAALNPAFAGTFKTITIDGDISDWTGIAPAYIDEDGTNNPTGVDFKAVYLANDANYLYIRYTLLSPADPISAWNTYLWFDNDTNNSTGFHPFGNVNFGSSLMIINDQSYQQAGGGWNEGILTNGNVAYGATSIPGTEFEFRIARNVSGVSGAYAGVPLLNSATIGVQLASETGTADSLPAWANYGTLFYTFADAPPVLTTNLPLVTLSSSAWRFEESGTDLGTNWLDQAYDDSAWGSGNGLLGYSPNAGAYPAINTALSSSGQNTYYFRTHFNWSNQVDNVAFVVTNYLSDGAVYYLNGVEVRRVRMPSGAVDFNTSASSTNSPEGHPDVFGLSPGLLLIGDNVLEVETHQAAASSSDMVFGLSLTAAAQYPILIVNSNLPADQTVLAGQSVTLTSDVLGSGPPGYQWWKDGLAVSGATNTWLTIPFALTNDAGSYTLVISNAFGTNITRTALLTVTNVPVELTDPSLPADTYVVEGRPVTLSVAAAGSPPMQYQWYKNNNLITDATNASYSITASVSADSGNYRVLISNLASSTNSRTAALTVLRDNIPPTITAISASASLIAIKFSEALDSVTANDASKYSVSGGINVVSAAQNPGDATEVTLTTGAMMNLGTVYILSVNGVKDVYGNAAQVNGQFVRSITIDGAFDDWTGLAPLYSSGAPSGNVGVTDFKDIYLYNDANYYYFRVTLWSDTDPNLGIFPYYVNMFFDTDNNIGTGYGPTALGSEMLIQSGYSYQEKNGTFNDGYGINNLNWLCLPAAPGTNFEFRISRSATFGQDNTPVFTADAINFIFQGLDSSFTAINQVPASGVLSYSNGVPPAVASLPLGRLAISAGAGAKAVIVWDSPGTLQVSSTLAGGVWTNLPSALSPYVIPASSGGEFFRLMH